MRARLFLATIAGASLASVVAVAVANVANDDVGPPNSPVLDCPAGQTEHGLTTSEPHVVVQSGPTSSTAPPRLVAGFQNPAETLEQAVRNMRLSIQHREPDSAWTRMRFEVIEVGEYSATVVGRDADEEVAAEFLHRSDGSWKWAGSALAAGPDGRFSWTLGNKFWCAEQR